MLPLGYEQGTDGPIGRDPRKMTVKELRECGHKPMSPQRAIWLRCLDCCGGQPGEVRMCTAIECPSWPFRMRRNPYRTKHQTKLAKSTT